MPIDDLYWNAIDFGSEESLHEFHAKQYVDPWDLENYAYIRDHLDSIDLSSNPSGGSSAAEFAGSSGEFAEANSTSFYYVPGHKKNGSQMTGDDRLQKYDSLLTEQGNNYVAIDELKLYERNRLKKELMDSYGRPQNKNRPENVDDFDSEADDESPYEEGITYSSTKRRYGKLMPLPTNQTPRDRSLSFSYGDYGHGPEGGRHEIYSKLDDYPIKKDSTLPMYEDERRSRRKPNNFGLSNYGHLKIDYSYSWNNLNKYICN